MTASITHHFQPAGTRAELVCIANWLADKAGWIAPYSADAIDGLCSRIWMVGCTFLVELKNSADERTVVDERDRYRDIARLAQELRTKLESIASPGMLLQPIGLTRNRADRTSRRGERDEHRIPSNLDVAYWLAWPSWGDRAHPLWWLEQEAKQVAKKLDEAKRQRLGYHAVTCGAPSARLCDMCSGVLIQIDPELVKRSERGVLAQFCARVWHYATGDDAPQSLAGQAKRAAARSPR